MQISIDTLLNNPFDAAAAYDSAAAVFEDPVFRYGQRSAWDRLKEWASVKFFQLADAVANIPGLDTIVRIAFFLILLVIALRILYWIALRLGWLMPRRRAGVTTEVEDPWGVAQQLAEEGQYLDALHMVYTGIIQAAHRKHLVTVHESKTTGDYVREVRRSVTKETASEFHAFTRTYEHLVYGRMTCSSQQYQEFLHSAQQLLDRLSRPSSAHVPNATYALAEPSSNKGRAA